MTSDQGTWLYLRSKTAGRLSFFSNVSRSGNTATWCWLPGCTKPVERSWTPGRVKWFHQQSCADSFRTRRRALDDAISELAHVYETNPPSGADKRRLRSDIEWLLGVRQAYRSPDAWRDADDSRSGSGPVSADEQFRDRLRLEAAPSDPCPTCGGKGDLSKLRPPIPSGMTERLKVEVNTLAEMASVFRRWFELRPGLETMREVERWEQLAREGERRLQSSLVKRPRKGPDRQA